MMHWPMLLLALVPQSPDTLPTHLGARVRIVTRNIARPLVGVMYGNDSGRAIVSVSDNGSTASIPWKDVTDVSASRGRAQGRGMVVGAVLGLVGGAVVYSMGAKPGPGDDPFGLDGLVTGLLAFGAAPAVGMLVGSVVVPERWEHMAVPRASESPASVAVSLQFGTWEKVRVTRGSEQLVGRVEQTTRDSLTVVTGNRTVPLSWSHVTTVEVRGARKRWLGAALGAGIGALVYEFGQSTSPATGDLTLIFVSSATVGGVVGALLLAPRLWKSLPLPSR